MTQEQRLIALAQAMGTDVKTLNAAIGVLSTLTTAAKTNLVAAINEVKVIAENAAGGGVAIDDGAGDGATTVTWSADKILDALEAAKLAVKNDLVDGAGATLDTLKELAEALGNDPSFAATIATELTKRVRYDSAQILDAAEQAQARSNIGAVGLIDVGDTDHNFVADYTAAKA